VAGCERADQAAAGAAVVGAGADSDQPAERAGVAGVDEVHHRRRAGQAPGGAAGADYSGGAGGDGGVGFDVVLADAAVVEVGAAADCGAAVQGAGACGAAAGDVLRYEQERAAGEPDYERRGGGAESGGDGVGGVCGRGVDGNFRVLFPDRDQSDADGGGGGGDVGVVVRAAVCVPDVAADFPGAGQDYGGGDGAVDRVAGGDPGD